MKNMCCRVGCVCARALYGVLLYASLASGPALGAAKDTGANPERLLLRLAEPVSVAPGRVEATAHTGPSAASSDRFATIADSLQMAGLSVARDLSGILVIDLPAGMSADAARALLAAHPDVLYAEPDIRVQPALVPNDPQYLTNQWFLWDTYGINAQTAWDSERGEAAIVVALLDTGILTHADLDAGRILPGYDFISSTTYSNDGTGWDADPSDPGDWVVNNECGAGEPAEDSSWHGLHLTGVVAATTDNAAGVAGINHVSRILPVRVLGKCGGSFSDIIAAMQWAAGLPVGGVPANANPAKVINLSFGGQQACTTAVQDAINQVVAAGAIVVAAAGNNNGTDVANIIPAGCNNVITVAGTTRAGALGSYSNLGSRVLVSAPGGGGAHAIRSIYNGGLTMPAGDAYADLQGTSMSSAVASGVVSLLLSVQPALTLGDVMFILQQTAQPFPAGGCVSGLCGSGIVDAAAAVQLAGTTAPGTHAGFVSTFFNSPAPAQAPSGGGGGGGGCTLVPASLHAGGHAVDFVLLVLAVLVMRITRNRSLAR